MITVQDDDAQFTSCLRPTYDKSSNTINSDFVHANDSGTTSPARLFFSLKNGLPFHRTQRKAQFWFQTDCCVDQLAEKRLLIIK